MSVTIQILGDLHLEFEDYEVTDTGADVIVLAGDIGMGTAGIQYAKSLPGDGPVIYIAGNHEYYGHSLDDLNDRMRREAAGSRVHFLEKTDVVVSEVRFLGCTLWSDFALFGAGRAARSAKEKAQLYMLDYYAIRKVPGGDAVTPEDTLAVHRESICWLESVLLQEHDGPTVVVTHNAPSPQSLSTFHAEDPLSAAFICNLEPLIHASQPELWIHGHTHFNIDYNIGRTRVLANQKGYPKEGVKDYDASLTVVL